MITNCLLQCKAFAQMCNFIGLLDGFFCLSFFPSELANTQHFLMYLSQITDTGLLVQSSGVYLQWFFMFKYFLIFLMYGKN